MLRPQDTAQIHAPAAPGAADKQPPTISSQTSPNSPGECKATRSQCHPSPLSPDLLAGWVTAAQVSVPGRRRGTGRQAGASVPGSPPASNEYKNKPTERSDLLCFCVTCTERKTLLLHPMNDIKPPAAHNKFTICSISPQSQRGRAPLPQHPRGKWTLQQGDKKSSYSPRAISHPGWNKLCCHKDFPGPRGVVWVPQFSGGKKSNTGVWRR